MTAPRAPQGEHTPVPWRLEHLGGDMYIVAGYNPALRVLECVGVYGDGTGLPDSDLARAKANINLIVRAVNAHADLVAALEAAEARLTKIARAFYISGKESTVKAAFDGWKVEAEQARAALARACEAGEPTAAEGSANV